MPKVLSNKEVSDFRDRLCKTAARQFAEIGYEKISMRSLADALCVSRMTPYRYFKDKAEILAAVRAGGFKQLINSTEKAMAEESKPVRQLEALAGAYLEFAVQHPDMYRLMFDMAQDNESEYPELLVQSERLHKLLIKASTVGVDAGIIQQDGSLAAQLFWAGMHGVVTLHMAGKLKLGCSFEDLAKEMTETLFRGLICRD